MTLLAASEKIGLWESSPTYDLDIGATSNTTAIRVQMTNSTAVETGYQAYGLGAHRYSQILWRDDSSSTFAKLYPYIGDSGSSGSLTYYGGSNRFAIIEIEDEGLDQYAGLLAYTVNKSSGGNDTGLLISKTDTSSTGTSLLINALTDDVSQFSVTDDGSAYLSTNIGIANDAPDVAVDVTGDIEYTGEITDVSDRRLKENITLIPDALAGIRKLNGVSFVMKDDPEENEELGLIAQDVQQAFPALVKQHPDGVLSLNYMGMIGPLVEAYKELDAKNHDLKQKLARLNNRLDALEQSELFAPPKHPYDNLNN